jgi:hypothetical protein
VQDRSAEYRMNDNFELTITILAIDEASAALEEMASRITADLAALSVDLAQNDEQLQQAGVAIEPIFTELAQESEVAQQALSGAAIALQILDQSLVSFVQDAAQALPILAEVVSALDALGAGQQGLGGFDLLASSGGASSGDLFGVTGLSQALGGFDLLATGGSSDSVVPILQQQLDVMTQLLGATQGRVGAQIVQNNTFNGVADASWIQEQVIPALERAAALGTTTLGRSS